MKLRLRIRQALLVAVCAGGVVLPAACNNKKAQEGKAPPAAGSGSASGAVAATPEAPPLDIDSKDILARTETAAEVTVRHVLFGWKSLADAYGGQMDPRAAGRSNADAAKLAQDTAAKLRATPADIEKISKELSEDPGSKGEPYTVNPTTGFVPEFKNLALRLKENEVGIVKTNFGYHVIMRIPPPPLDPLESADILGRTEAAAKVVVQHVLVGWKDVPAAAKRPVDERAKNRDKAAADKLAQEVLAKAKGGADFTKLMKEFSEDPGSKDSGEPYTITPSTPFVDSFKKLGLRLKENEVGLVQSPFGWHVIKRLPPPPPDKLESADILAKKPVTEKAKVKHVLLAYKDTKGASDERAKKRTRAELETLVAKILGDLKAKKPIEPIMAEHSEDPGSAKNGQSYEVAPDAPLVEPFKELSLRLAVGEFGVVKTDFGYHIILRTE